ncbi:hypothetical protein CVT26_004267 [Gymnopilus dilepis]|uniref:Uncharacterized protein n=1 Tax=Gymnopilus dilepis TaxID=231916 RepID=A0A409WYI5_9AGAR|nr:hypothetical protein CVT26_004267 [Gymnopilus dilepis]
MAILFSRSLKEWISGSTSQPFKYVPRERRGNDELPLTLLPAQPLLPNTLAPPLSWTIPIRLPCHPSPSGELGCPQATTPTHAPEHSTRPPSLPLIRQDALLRADTIPFPSIGSVANTTHHDYEIQRKDEKRTFWTRHRVENDNGMSRTYSQATSTIGGPPDGISGSSRRSRKRPQTAGLQDAEARQRPPPSAVIPKPRRSPHSLTKTRPERHTATLRRRPTKHLPRRRPPLPTQIQQPSNSQQHSLPDEMGLRASQGDTTTTIG